MSESDSLVNEHFGSNPRTYLSPGRALRAGEVIGQILLHAADKQATVDDIAERIRAPRAHALGRYALRTEMADLKEQLASEQEKLGRRAGEAASVFSTDLEVRLTEVGDKSMLRQGRLTAADFRNATLTLKASDDQVYEQEFATNLPVPDGLDQTYYGMDLTVGIEVVSLPKGKEWILE